MVLIDSGAATYAYDAAGRRIKKTVGGSTTFYFYGPEGLGIISEFTTTPGVTGANSTDRTVYRTSDKIGTAVLLINNGGLVVENNRTLSYGEAWLSDVGSLNEQKFTSYMRDPESGLDYAMRRYNSASMGRFVSPDPTFKNVRLEDPQSWNMYTYVQNDPINYTDPSGEFLKGLLKKIVKVVAVAVVAVVAPPLVAPIIANIAPAIVIGGSILGPAIKAGLAVGGAILSAYLVKTASDLLDRLRHKAEAEPQDAPFNPEDEITDPDQGWEQVDENTWQRLRPDGTWQSLHRDDGIRTGEGPHWDWRTPAGRSKKIWPDGTMTGPGRR